jgi:hypothetical protein
MPKPLPKRCPHCNALYQVVRVEAVSTVIPVRKIPCLNCGGNLDTRKGSYLLKWFLVSPLQRDMDVSRGSHRRRIYRRNCGSK